jgi:hypothetical protein
MNAGVIADFKHRIERNASDIHELNLSIQRLHLASFTQEQMKDVVNVVSWFKGWKLVILSLLALVPTATLILNYIKP